MRQLCPKCLKPVEVPESAAGGETTCPACDATFAVPKVYTPTVVVPPSGTSPVPEPEPETYGVAPPAARPPLPPGFQPPADRPQPPPGYAPPVPPAPPPAVPSASESAGEHRSIGVTVSPQVLGWVPFGCLLGCFVLSFFSWVGSYPGGVRVFSQSLYDTMGRSVDAFASTEELQKTEAEINKLVPTNWLMWLYMPGLFAAVFLAGLERLFREPPPAHTLPGPLAWLPTAWPKRFLLLTALAGVLLLLVAYQSWRGFGLETAVREYAAAPYQKKVEEADTPTKQQIVRVEIGQAVGRFALSGTLALRAVLVLHVVAVVVYLLRWWLDARGAKAAPRFELQY
jgi:hypothetical protein